MDPVQLEDERDAAAAMRSSAGRLARQVLDAHAALDAAGAPTHHPDGQRLAVADRVLALAAGPPRLPEGLVACRAVGARR